MKSRGCTDEEARTCIIWGCYEWGVRNSANGNGAGHQNLLKNVELLLADAKEGRLEGLRTFADFKADFYCRLGASLEKHIRLVKANDRHLADVNPSDLFALSVGYSVEKGLAMMRAVVEQYFANGGMVIQFNVHDPKTLRDAQKHPEKYENLQVRVCGWNVRWNDIPKVEQDKFIARVDAIVE